MTKSRRGLPTVLPVCSVLILLLCGVLMVGCDFQSLQQSPQQKTLERLETVPDVKTAQILGSRSWSDGTVVLYALIVSTTGPGLPMEMFGVDVHTSAASFDATGAHSSSGKGTTQSLLCHGLVLGNNYAVVYGMVKHPDIDSVEADFANGATRRDKASDGLYTIIEPANTTPKTVRALSSTGQVLYQVSITPPAAIDAMPTPLQCGP